MLMYAPVLDIGDCSGDAAVVAILLLGAIGETPSRMCCMCTQRDCDAVRRPNIHDVSLCRPQLRLVRSSSDSVQGPCKLLAKRHCRAGAASADYASYNARMQGVVFNLQTNN